MYDTELSYLRIHHNHPVKSTGNSDVALCKQPRTVMRSMLDLPESDVQSIILQSTNCSGLQLQSSITVTAAAEALSICFNSQVAVKLTEEPNQDRQEPQSTT